MKLVQLNIWQGRLIKQSLKLLLAENPDIICLQEVPSSDIKVPGFLETNTLQQLLEKLPLDHHAYAPRWQYALMGGTASYGLAILSRFPIQQQDALFTIGKYNENFVYGHDDHTMSNIQRVILDCDGKTLTVFNNHGYHQVNPEGNDITLATLAKAAEWTDQSSGPVIFTGDLNVWPQSRALQPLNQRFRNLTVESGTESTLSQIGNAYLPCDYIFVNDQINVQHFTVPEELVSDHKALILEFDI